MTEDDDHHPKPGRLSRVIFGRRLRSTAHAAGALGIGEDSFSVRLHRLKRSAGLRGNDDIIVYDDGDAFDTAGDCIGNIYDEDG